MIDRMDLINCNGQILAQFLRLDNSFLGYPMVVMTHDYLRDVSFPGWVFPGQIWNEAGFIGYVAATAAADRARCPWTLRRQADDIQLDRHMSVLELARVLGVDAELVRQVLHNHLTFTEARAG